MIKYKRLTKMTQIKKCANQIVFRTFQGIRKQETPLFKKRLKKFLCQMHGHSFV